ncbi:MAG: hypothetical protein ACQSGP_04745 [Frankia sp.]
MSPLRPEELQALLHAAVDDLRPAPDGYQRIRAGIDRRRRWRIPAYAAGAAVLAGLTALAFFAISPSAHTQVVEPASPITSHLGSGTVVPSASGTASSSVGGTPPPPVLGGTGASSGPTAPGRTSPATSATAGSPTVTPTRGSANASPATVAKNGDIDGDGIVDSDLSYNGTALVVTLSHNKRSVAVTLAGVTTPLHYAVTDIDDDGRGEILVEVSGAIGVTTYDIVRLQSDGSLRVLSKGPLPLVVGASSSSGTGFACSGGVLLVRSGTSDDGTTYQVTTTSWTLSGVTFTQVGKARTASYDTTSNAADPFRARCGTL